jgi:hypothetical protein
MVFVVLPSFIPSLACFSETTPLHLERQQGPHVAPGTQCFFLQWPHEATMLCPLLKSEAQRLWHTSQLPEDKPMGFTQYLMNNCCVCKYDVLNLYL